MILRVAFFILMALALVGFGTVAWVATRQPPPAVAVAPAPAPAPIVAAAAPAPAPTPKKKILSTARSIAAGTMLKPEDIIALEAAGNDADGLLDAAIPDAVRRLAGSMAKHAMGPKDPIRSDDVIKPSDHGFMAAVLQPGMRAVTISVDATSGSAGLVWPGDRVDLILTQTLTDPALPPGRRVAAETVLINSRVIAIDQQLMQGASSSTDGPARTVTLEVSPDEVQRVSVAMRLGRLSLSVRAIAQGGDGSARAAAGKGGSVYARDVSSAFGGDTPAPVDRTVRVFQGSSDPKEFKY